MADSAGTSWAYTPGVTKSASELLKDALRLDEQDRASLAGALIESLHGAVESGAREAWDVEIERRVRELESRAVETVPWSVVRERLFHGFE
jgi:putative addiction module component (TIGR02574 family)